MARRSHRSPPIPARRRRERCPAARMAARQSVLLAAQRRAHHALASSCSPGSCRRCALPSSTRCGRARRDACRSERRSAPAGPSSPTESARSSTASTDRRALARRSRSSLLVAGIVWLTWLDMPRQDLVAVYLLIAYPVVAYFLLLGGFGLELSVPTSLGRSAADARRRRHRHRRVAAARRSARPRPALASCRPSACLGVFIEFWRGVPLVTVLFMASVMLPLFVPHGVVVDKLLRALIAVALFYSAYMAEVVRGGLQAIPKGQYEAATALGLGYWRTMRLIILPQALRLAIPNIVTRPSSALQGHDAGLDHRLLRSARHHPGRHVDANWATRDRTPVISSPASSFWYSAFSMSRYSRHDGTRLLRARGDEERMASAVPPATAPQDEAVEIIGVAQVVQGLPGAARHRPAGHQGRAARHLRPVGLGQIDADPLHQPARAASAGQGRRRRHRADRRHRARSTRCAARSAWCSSSSICFRI